MKQRFGLLIGFGAHRAPLQALPGHLDRQLLLRDDKARWNFYRAHWFCLSQVPRRLDSDMKNLRRATGRPGKE